MKALRYFYRRQKIYINKKSGRKITNSSHTFGLGYLSWLYFICFLNWISEKESENCTMFTQCNLDKNSSGITFFYFLFIFSSSSFSSAHRVTRKSGFSQIPKETVQVLI